MNSNFHIQSTYLHKFYHVILWARSVNACHRDDGMVNPGMARLFCSYQCQVWVKYTHDLQIIKNYCKSNLFYSDENIRKLNSFSSNVGKNLPPLWYSRVKKVWRSVDDNKLWRLDALGKKYCPVKSHIQKQVVFTFVTNDVLKPSSLLIILYSLWGK